MHVCFSVCDSKSKKCKRCDAHKSMDRHSNECQMWKVDQDLVCTINHTGSSGKMEVDGVLDMFKRSVEKKDLRYLSFIGDGDSSTFKTVSEAKPYGSDVVVEKKECVGHIQKRMGTRLQKLKASFAKKDLSDGDKNWRQRKAYRPDCRHTAEVLWISNMPNKEYY